jgi:hypothetical protein
MFRSSRIASTTRRLTTTVAGLALGAALSVAAVAAPVQAFAETTVAPAAAAAADGPALWVIRDADSTLYLFGTVHVLKPSTEWRSARVDAAFASAADIWFEISNPDDQAAIIPLIQQYGVSPQTPLSSLLTPEEFAELDRAAKVIGASGQQIDVFRPWFAGLTLSMAPLVQAGYDPQSGVELVLKAQAEAAGKSIHGLETIDKQIRILAELPQDIQLEFLRSTLGEFDNAATQLDTMVAAWASGDVDGLNTVAVAPMKTEAPHVYDALLVQRNTDWANQIQTILNGSGVGFIAVGAAHLTGEDSVQAILARRGVTAERQ